MRREFLMLSNTYDPSKHNIAGYYMSEKLDGFRAFWDGGISRGQPTISIPWANVLNPKTGSQKDKIRPIATGLWSRYGNPIMAPDWFLNELPCCPFDGELWAGRGGFQIVTSVCRKNEPVDEEWKKVQYAVFGTPNIWGVFQDGTIKNANFLREIKKDEIMSWLKSRKPGILENFVYLHGDPPFAAELANLNHWLDSTAEYHFLIRQVKLSDNENAARALVQHHKKKVIEAGGEGLVLRDPNSIWIPKRTPAVLKVKGQLDDEGVVVGFTAGRKTDKGSKLLGKIGALILDYNGERLELAGLTDEEREFAESGYSVFASANPGEDMPDYFQGKHFKVGDKATFTYRELTDKGVPKEARYLRKRG